MDTHRNVSTADWWCNSAMWEIPYVPNCSIVTVVLSMTCLVAIAFSTFGTLTQSCSLAHTQSVATIPFSRTVWLSHYVTGVIPFIFHWKHFAPCICHNRSHTFLLMHFKWHSLMVSRWKLTFWLISQPTQLETREHYSSHHNDISWFKSNTIPYCEFHFSESHSSFDTTLYFMWYSFTSS